MALLMFLIIILFFIFITGLCVGSFLNVVISRAFSKESIISPASKCPACQTPLKWYHNIPVLSFLFLRGKCAFCEEKISVQYPIVELITGILFLLVFIQFGISVKAIFILIFTSLFIVIAATDIKERIVFDFHTYALVVFGLIYNLFNIGHLYLGDKVLTLGHFSIGINNSLIASLLGILLGIVVIEAFARFGYLVAGTRAFGEGDTYIAAGLGAIFGWEYLLTVLAYAFVIQIVLTMPVFIKKLYEGKDYKTLGSLFAFFALVFLIKWLEYKDITNNFVIFLALTLILLILGIYVCKRILGGLREEQNRTYLPFGPAMVTGAMILLFII